MGKLARSLASPKLAWWLLIILLGCLVISFLVPQRAIVGDAIYSSWRADTGFVGAVAESLGFASIFSSPIFLLSMSLLFVNLSFCTVRRMLGRKRLRTRGLNAPPSAEEVDVRPDVALEDVAALHAPAWAIHEPVPGQYFWERGAWGWRGSLLMHFGLLLLLVAGVASGLTRFSGELVLSEGQTLADAPDSYTAVTQVPRFGSAFSGAPLTLQKLEVTYEGSTIVDVVAHMSEGPQGPARAVRVNEPFRAGGKAYLLSKSGHAVGLKVSEGGDSLLDAIVNLGGVSARGNTDSVSVRPGLDVTMTVLPDGEAGTTAKVRQRLLLVDPVVEVSAAGAKTPVVLRPGQSAQIGAVTVEIKGVEYWTQFLARSDRGLPIAYVAFAMILIGIIARWIDPEVRVALVLSDDRKTARVWHRSRFSDAAGQRAKAALIDEIRANGRQGGE